MLVRSFRGVGVVLLLFLCLSFVIRVTNVRPNLHGWAHIPRGNWTSSWIFPDYLSIGQDKEQVALCSSNSTESGNHTSASVTEHRPKPIPQEPSPYAFVFYATQDDYACAVLVNIDRLVNVFRTRHRVFVLVTPVISERFLQAFRKFNATIITEEPPKIAEGSNLYYDGCLLKLLSFRMHQIDPTVKRLLSLEADQLILRNLDHIFELPPVDLAAPRAYWVGKDAVASTFLLICPSDRLWAQIKESLEKVKKDVYDMDIVNKVLGKTVVVLPGSYAALNSHWAEWTVPDWFRPEEIKVMEEIGRTTGKTGFVKQDAKELRKLANLEFAIKKWKTDAETEEDQENSAERTIFKRQTESDASANQPEKNDVSGTQMPSEPRGDGPQDGVVDEPRPGESNQIENGNSEQYEKQDKAKDEKKDGSEIASEQEHHEATEQPDMQQPPEQPKKEEINKKELDAPLYDLHRVSYALHFTFGGKPWSAKVEEVGQLIRMRRSWH
ncbi:nucleotide-diphospho-sugar transferase [Rhizodiscina lignyota]|uniref:Nucleotide-diphospho-sugar transferase n=1 Tax=Rhizodiscina lignyota TaxID=1504668 RepID=A0A9P4I664_9PEZI|nr:nucleotide-diphospho-sugar transferase [Rhizodiscina lignyota]